MCFEKRVNKNSFQGADVVASNSPSKPHSNSHILHGKLSIDCAAGYDALRPLENLTRNRSRISVWIPDESEELLRLAHRCRTLNRSNDWTNHVDVVPGPLERQTATRTAHTTRPCGSMHFDNAEAMRGLCQIVGQCKNDR
jgi:hypothetical protein